MNILYNIDKFLRPTYQIVGAGIEWAILLLIIALVVYVLWKKIVGPLWRRTWLWQVIDWNLFRHRFVKARNEDKREFVNQFMQRSREYFIYRIEKGRRPMITQGYYERLFAQTEKMYAEEPGR